ASACFEGEQMKPIVIGRANRSLHWQDILFFKARQYQFYDFLGISQEANNQEQRNINKFNKGFASKEVTEFQSYVPHTIKGTIMMFILRWLWRNQAELVKRKYIEKSKQLDSKLLD